MEENTDTADESRRSRRSVLGGLASLGVALGRPNRAGATHQTQNDDGTTQRASQYRARIYASDFRPEARFRVASEPLDYKPRVEVQEGEAFLESLYWNDFGTRIVHYERTGERVLFFPALDAPIERGSAYRMDRILSTDQLAEGIVGVGFEPVEDADRTEG